MLSIGVPIAMQWWEGTRQSFKFYHYQNLFSKVSKDFKKIGLYDQDNYYSFEIFILAHEIIHLSK